MSCHVGAALLKGGARGLVPALGGGQQVAVGVPLRWREGQDGGGQAVVRAGRRSDLGVEIVDQRLQHAEVVVGQVRLRFRARSRQVRDHGGGRAERVACHGCGREHQHVDPEVGENVLEVGQRLLVVAVVLDLLVQLLQWCDVVAEVGDQSLLARPETLRRVGRVDGSVEGVDAVVDVLGRPCLQPGEAGRWGGALLAVAGAPGRGGGGAGHAPADAQRRGGSDRQRPHAEEVCLHGPHLCSSLCGRCVRSPVRTLSADREGGVRQT